MVRKSHAVFGEECSCVRRVLTGFPRRCALKKLLLSVMRRMATESKTRVS